MHDIRIIKGDDTFIELEMPYVESSLVEYIKFTCKGLGLEVETHHNDNKLILFFSRDITSDLEVGLYDYDIALYLTDGQETTIIYRAPIRVYEKVNK